MTPEDRSKRVPRKPHPPGLKVWNVTVALHWPRDEGLLKFAMAKFGVKSRSAALRCALRYCAGENIIEDKED